MVSLRGALGAIVIVSQPFSVVPGDDDLVVIPFLDVPEVAHDGELELVGLPLAAEAGLDRLTGDDEAAGCGDPHEPRHVLDGAALVRQLDGLDDGAVGLALLDVHADGAGGGGGAHALVLPGQAVSAATASRTVVAEASSAATEPAPTSSSARAATGRSAASAATRASAEGSASSSLFAAPVSGSAAQAL